MHAYLVRLFPQKYIYFHLCTQEYPSRPQCATLEATLLYPFFSHNSVLCSYRGFLQVTFLLIVTTLSPTPDNTGHHPVHNPRPGQLIASEAYYRHYSKKLTHIHRHTISFKPKAFLSADKHQFTTFRRSIFSNINMHAAAIPYF